MRFIWLFRLQTPPLQQLCNNKGKPLPTLHRLQNLARHAMHFYREDFAVVKGPKGGPIRSGMGYAIAKYLGVEANDIFEITEVEWDQHFKPIDLFFGGFGMLLSAIGKNNIQIHEKSILKNYRQIQRAAIDVEVSGGVQALLKEGSTTEGRFDYSAINFNDLDSLQLKGQELINLPGEHTFEELLREWWDKNKMVVLQAYRSKDRVGTAVLLPITETTYQKIKRGEIRESDIRGDDIVFETTYFLALVGSTRYGLIHGGLAPMTKAIGACFLTQLAAAIPKGQEEQVSIISFNAVPVAMRRLMECGFQQIPGVLHGTSWPLMEFTPDSDAGLDLIRGIHAARLFPPQKHRVNED